MSAKNDAKPKGQSSAYAFFVKSCRDEVEKTSHDKVAAADFLKTVAERWKTMGDKAKARFEAMAVADKRRFQAEMKNYTSPAGKKSARGKGSGRVKKVKDHNAPKRALSAFFWFCSEERPKIRSANPDLKMGDVAKECGQRWAVVSKDAKTKAKFDDLAKRDKVRYEQAMAQYSKKVKVAAVAAEESDEDEEEDDEME